MYIIENFMTRAAIGTLRPVTSDVCIILNESSIVTNIPLEIVRFPRYKFEITEIGDIYSVARNLDPGQPPVYALGHNSQFCYILCTHSIIFLF